MFELLPLEIKRKILLMLPFEKVYWIVDNEFWNEKIKRDFVAKTHSDAKKCYILCERANDLMEINGKISGSCYPTEGDIELIKQLDVIILDSLELSGIEHSGPYCIEDMICTILLNDLDIYLEISRSTGWLADKLYTLLVEHIIVNPYSMHGYQEIDQSAYSQLADVASENDKRTDEFISKLFHCGRYIHDDGGINIFEPSISVFDSREIKASYLIKLFIEEIDDSDTSFITEGQISREVIDNDYDPVYETTWGSDNEDLLRPFGSLICLRAWLSEYSMITEDLPLGFKMYPPYNSKDIKDHLYWLVVHHEFAAC